MTGSLRSQWSWVTRQGVPNMAKHSETHSVATSADVQLNTDREIAERHGLLTPDPWPLTPASAASPC
jgi:hypothetical protein